MQKVLIEEETKKEGKKKKASCVSPFSLPTQTWFLSKNPQDLLQAKLPLFPRGLSTEKPKLPKQSCRGFVNHHGPNVHGLTARLQCCPVYRGLVVVLSCWKSVDLGASRLGY